MLSSIVLVHSDDFRPYRAGFTDINEYIDLHILQRVSKFHHDVGTMRKA